jgi:Xaa-Pro dipeptidase
MDTPEATVRNDVVPSRNMVFFLHMILMNSDTGHAFRLGRTYIIGAKRPEPLSAYSQILIMR